MLVIQTAMKKIRTYSKHLCDQESFTPACLFESLNQTNRHIKTEQNIQYTEQTLITTNLQGTTTQSIFPHSIQNLHFHPIQQKSKEMGSRKDKSSRRGSVFASEDLNNNQMMKKRKKWQELKDVLTNQKINVLKDIFVQKLKRNNPYSPPIQFQIIDQSKKLSILDEEGIQISQLFDHIFSFVMIAQIMVSLFVFTLALVLPEISSGVALIIVQTVALLISVLQMAINFIHQKTVSGRKLKKLRDISINYLHTNFSVDIINIIALILSLSTGLFIFNYFRLIVAVKISQVFQKLQKLQIYLIQNYYNQQYWSLIKTVIFNFCFAHILAVLLIAMTNVNQEINWMVVKKIDQAQWFERYIWSYYWGTNIMLTVGFGDIVATTYQQAICLIFIQTVSCLALAYNINCVGNLIANIRSQDLQKSKNFKLFKKLILKNNLSQELSWRINNYIQESINIKKKFSLQEEKLFIQKLPNGFKKQVLKQSNKNIFQKITFFHSLMEKTLYSLAERIEMCIYHPEEIIQPMQDNYNLLIVKTGEIGYVCKKPESSFHNQVIDIKKITNEDKPFLINLHFITKKRQHFQVKSLVYSILYYLDHDKLIQILNQSPMDYQLYSYLKDKNKNVVDEFEVFPCEYCKTKHTKFNCPKIHYIPLAQHVINRYLRAYKYGLNSRSDIKRITRTNFHSLQNFHQLQDFNPTEHKFIKQKQIKDTLRRKNTIKIAQNLKKQRMKEDPLKEQSFARMQVLFMEHTTQVIKEQLTKLLGAEQYEDQIWNLKLDRMKNLKGYFPSDNSSNLREKFNLQKRLQGIHDRFKSPEQAIEDKHIYSIQAEANDSDKFPHHLIKKVQTKSDTLREATHFELTIYNSDSESNSP